jgi:hypothetical protein
MQEYCYLSVIVRLESRHNDNKLYKWFASEASGRRLIHIIGQSLKWADTGGKYHSQWKNIIKKGRFRTK